MSAVCVYVTVVVITGGRDRTPTVTELESVVTRLRARGATVARHGGCSSGKLKGSRRGGTDPAVAAYLKARARDIEVQAWPAEDFGAWPYCGPKRNRGMLDGKPAGSARPGATTLGLFSESAPERQSARWTEPAAALIALEGGAGTTDCTKAALGERWLPVDWISAAAEPRPWNRHHGAAPEPSIYIGRGTLLGNPWPLSPGEDRQSAAVRILGAYRRWLWALISPGRERDPKIVEMLDSISDQHHLVCSCWPAACHAEVVIGAWRWRKLCAWLGEAEARAMLKERKVTPSQALAELDAREEIARGNGPPPS